MLHVVSGDAALEPIDPEHLAGVLDNPEQVKARRLATDAEVEAAFRRFDR
jgi:hypothetical protein